MASGPAALAARGGDALVLSDYRVDTSFPGGALSSGAPVGGFATIPALGGRRRHR